MEADYFSGALEIIIPFQRGWNSKRMDFDEWNLWKSVAVFVSCLKAVIMIMMTFYISPGVLIVNNVSQWGSREGHSVGPSLCSHLPCTGWETLPVYLCFPGISDVQLGEGSFTLQLPSVMVKFIMPQEKGWAWDAWDWLWEFQRPDVLGNGTVLLSLPGAWDNPS